MTFKQQRIIRHLLGHGSKNNWILHVTLPGLQIDTVCDRNITSKERNTLTLKTSDLPDKERDCLKIMFSIISVMGNNFLQEGHSL